MQDLCNQGNTVAEISVEELALVSGGEYAAIQPWALGTSGAFQKMMVAKLEILGNPIGPNGH
jgi:hypothetical protein